MKHIYYLSVALISTKRNRLFALACLISLALTLSLFPKSGFSQAITPGDIDQAFGTATGANQAINCMALHGSSIVIGGSFSAFSGNGISRLNFDGTRDLSFNQSSTSFNGPVNAVAIQQDGKIIAGGAFSHYGFIFRGNLARLNIDGTLDMSFANLNTTNGMVRAVVIQPDGKILIAGDFSTVNGVSRNRIARLNADGTLDETFNTTAPSLNNSVMTISLLNNGKIFVGGNFITPVGNGTLVLNSDGSIDFSFNVGAGLNNGGMATACAVQPDGKIIIGGTFSSFNGFNTSNLVRLNVDGTRDATFQVGNNLNQAVNAIALQNNSKIFIGGRFTAYGSVQRFGLARLLSNGSLDTTFDPGLGSRNGAIDVGPVRAILVCPPLVVGPAPNGSKLIIAGDFIAYDGVPRARIAQVHFKSTQTLSFDPLPQKIYGDGPFRLTAIASSGLTPVFVSPLGSPVVRIQGDSATIVGAGNEIVFASQQGNDDFYFSNTVSQPLTVMKASLAAFADNKTRSFGENNPPLTIRYEGFIGSDDAALLDVQPVASTTATPTSPPGVYPIILNGGSDNNYVFTAFVNGTLTVTAGLPDVFVTNPADSAVGVNLNVSVVAKAVSGATTYIIQLSPSQNFSSGVLELSGARSQRFTGLAYGTRYFARVRTNRSPLFGKVTSFTTIRAEDLAFMTSPGDSAVNRNITLNVTSNTVPGASVYTIELNQLPDFPSGISLIRSGERTQRFTGLGYNNRYYCRVKTNLSENWGPTRSFTTMDAAQLSFVLTPKDSAINQKVSLNVTSNNVPSAIVYTIELNTSPEFTGTSIIKTGARTQKFSGLEFSTTYYNRVKTDQSENWGATHMFTTVAATATITIQEVNTDIDIEDAPEVLTDVAVNIFPNPFIDHTEVVMISESTEKLVLVVTDFMGEEKIKTTITTGETLTIGHNLQPGIYLLKFFDGAQFRVERIIKK